MIEFLRQLRQRKLVQWSLAYIAAAFAVIQGVDVVAGHFDWPASSMRYLILAFVVGFFVAVAMAWYHGERGAQHVGGAEILIIALLLAIGGGLIAHFGPPTTQPDDIRAPQPAPTNVMGEASGVATPEGGRTMSANVTATPVIPAKSIAVLPFENLSGDKDNVYFVSGIQELILTKLSGISGLKVIARTSTAGFHSRPDDLPTIGRQLGVATVLEGSVQKAGNRVLINVRLVRTQTSSNIWAESYTRSLDDIFGVEGEVAQTVAQTLQAKLSAAESASLASVATQNKVAFDLFLRAEYLSLRGDLNRDTAQWKAAIPLYRQAIAADPGFALAYARLSMTLGSLAWFGGGGEDFTRLAEESRRDAERSLQLAPNLATAQAAMGYYHLTLHVDLQAASRAFDAALALRPNDADALAGRAFIDRRQSRFGTALDWLQQAFAHDPRNSWLASEIGSTCMMMDRYDEAQTWAQRALTLDPTNTDATLVRSRAILVQSGDVSGALAASDGDAPTLRYWRARLLTLQRQYAAASKLLESVPDAPDSVPLELGSVSLLAGNLQRLMGNLDKARPLFERALGEAQAQVGKQQGLNLAMFWQRIANAELGLGRTREGLAATAKAQAIIAGTPDSMHGPGKNSASLSITDAILYALADRAGLAVPLLAKALATPGVGGDYSPRLLAIDPAWDPIRTSPQFQALLAQYAKDKPAVIPAVPTANASPAATLQGSAATP